MTKEITIPRKLLPLVKAFNADEPAARILIKEAIKALCCKDSLMGYGMREPAPEEIEGVIALMKGIAPADTLELIQGAQIICSHLMGLRMLSHDYPGDQMLGLKLLRFSNEAALQLQKKRAGGTSQNINITYNHMSGPAVMHTIIPQQSPKDEDTSEESYANSRS